MCDKKDPADVFSQVCEQLLVFVSLFNESVVIIYVVAIIKGNMG